MRNKELPDHDRQEISTVSQEKTYSIPVAFRQVKLSPIVRGNLNFSKHLVHSKNPDRNRKYSVKLNVGVTSLGKHVSHILLV